MSNLFVWLDIPVKNLNRGMDFYQNVLGITMKKEKYPDFEIGMFPGGDNGLSGCLYEEKKDIQNDIGPLLYFNVDGRLEDAEKKVTEFQGQVLNPKHPIGPHGWRVVAKDSEGNRIALHSTKE